MVKIGKTILKNYESIPNAFKVGRRVGEIHGKSALHGFVYGAKKAGRNIGTLPLVAAAAGVCCCPLPGAGFVGLTIGTLLKEGGKYLLKALK